MIYCYQCNILPLQHVWKPIFAINLLKKIFLEPLLSTHVREDDFLTRAIFDLLHFSPHQNSQGFFLTMLGGKRHAPQQIAFVCQQLGKFLFLGKLVPVPEAWKASLGQSFPDCGLQSPQGHEEFKGGSEVLEKTVLVSSCWLFPGWKSEAVVSRD